MKKYTLFLLLFLASSAIFPAINRVSAQEWLRREIEAFKQEDATKGTHPDCILFLGSSSIRMWDNINAYFPGYPVVKRGFGGSSMRQAILYFDDLVLPHSPKQIIIYFGDNDLSSNDGYTVGQFMSDVRCFVRMVQIHLPQTQMSIISIKPSPARRAHFGNYIEANKQLKELCETTDNMSYIDLWTPMVNADNRLKEPSMFRSDSLHMYESGYKLWSETITPYLIK